MNTKLKPLVEALGMNPAWWMHRFTFISKQVWYDEKVSRALFDHRQKQRDEIAGMIMIEAARILDSNPVPMEGRMIA